jgi:hypothetical protein
MENWDRLPGDELIQKTIVSLNKNGIDTDIVNNGREAKDLIIKLIPPEAEVMNMTSVTLDSISVSQEINESGRYNSVRNELNKMDRSNDDLKMQKLGAAPEYVVGSVHAVTSDGKILIASKTGSQLPAYVYGSKKVIWIVSTKKIVDNLNSALKRIYEHVLPLESDRVRKAYGTSEGSFVSKLLIINREVKPDRARIIFVKEDLGF